jgi:hypothetical protein
VRGWQEIGDEEAGLEECEEKEEAEAMPRARAQLQLSGAAQKSTNS